MCKDGYAIKNNCEIISNCLHTINDNGTLKCEKCSPGFVLLNSDKTCVDWLTLIAFEKSTYLSSEIVTRACDVGETDPCY